MANDSAEPRAEDWYRQVLDTAPDAMVIVGPDEKIRYVNAQLERLFGYAGDDLLGHGIETLIPDRFRRGHGTHVARFFSSPGTRPMGTGLELFGKRADGSEIAIEVSLSPVRTAQGVLVSAAIRDISDRRHAEAAVRLAAERLSSAVESIEDALALFDADDRLVMCNSAYRSLVGPAVPGTLTGKPYVEMLDAWTGELEFGSEEQRARFRTARLAARSERTSTFDVRTRDGRHLRVTDRRTVEGGLVKTIWDLTGEVTAASELAAARAAAEEASSAKSEFLSSMSHELRTPLNAILGFAQLLRRDKKEPQSERHRGRTDEILKGGEHLLRLIDDILDLSSIEARAVSMSVEPVNVGDVLREVSATLEPMASRAGLSVQVDVPAHLPMIAVDQTRFSQILMNFGSNAIKYNRPAGTVTFSVTILDDGHVRVTVSDTGTGIPVDKQSKLFQPFQRAGQETGPIEGTGIGLVITKRLAELMSGSVGFRSTPWEGSDFWVDMPIHAETESTAKDEAPQAAPGLKLDLGGRRVVLYVEDNPANVTFMRDLLGELDDLELITAPTAEMGIELARARKPAVVIMDINLPGMSGLDALYALRGDRATHEIPVIALTAAASERDKQRGQQAGFYRYLTKPVRVDELEAALQELLAPRAPGATR
jgi:PAS domain S-box-containing protein